MTNFWEKLPKPFFILAPMDEVTDVVFRHVINQAGRPDVYFTEFTNSASYCSPAGKHSTHRRLTFTPDEQPIVAQIWGNNPEHFEIMGKGLAEQGFAGIDINFGCPVADVVKQSCGIGVIKNPELASQLISSAKLSGLPVSVKTRLGYSQTDEWADWLGHILRQDIANLTIHLRTKKEMSKVPAHFELIPKILALRDKLAPNTLITINGDIANRQHGLKLVEQYGVDGVMIGRGVFTNPFAFKDMRPEAPSVSFLEGAVADRASRTPQASQSEPVENTLKEKDAEEAFNLERAPIDDEAGVETRKQQLISLLHLHLDLHDEHSVDQPRKFDPLKKFFKIYIRDFPGASELRNQLMQTKSTAEAREVLETFSKLSAPVSA